jgi:oxygen-independent coproporphyrinogen-3 oxidase
LALEDAVDPVILAACVEEGYLVSTPGRLAATREGRARLDAVLPRLVK